MRVFYLVLLSLLFFADNANAATREAPAYRKTVAEANFPWSEGFTLRFDLDEKLCKQHYGNKWRLKCAAPLGQPGQSAYGLAMTPPAEGFWEWQTPSSLVFHPRNGSSIRANTVYSLDLSKLALPLSVKLDRQQLAFKTLPPAARLLESVFLIDPARAGIHRLVQSYQFNYPVAPQDFSFKLQLPALAQAGQAELVWNNAKDQLNISWPIRKLAPTAQAARLVLPRFGQISQTDDGIHFQPAGREGAIFYQNLPAAGALFKINEFKLAFESAANLDRRFVLELQTSLHTRAKDVLARLQVLELPLFNSKGATLPYDWRAAPAIPKDIVAKARKLAPQALQRPDAIQSRFRFVIPAQAGRQLLVLVEPGLAAESGLKLAAPWHGIAKAQDPGGQTGFVQQGNILPGSGVLDIFGIDLDSINWTVQLAREPFLALLAQGSDNAFEEPLERLNLRMDSIAESIKGQIQLPGGKAGEARFATLDLAQALRKLGNSPSGIALVSLRGQKAGKEQGFAKKIVLVSNLGLIAKRGSNGKLYCFAQNLETGKPAGQAKISILGANGKALATAIADNSGYAALPAFDSQTGENLPVAVIAGKDNNLAWLPLRDASRELNLTSFATGGSHIAPDGLQAFVFDQRGLYRPGETMHFGIMPRRGDFSLLPEDLPLHAELLDPRGLPLLEKIIRPGPDGLAELAFALPQDSLSGRYHLNVRNARHGLVLGSCEARVENFQPDTLRLKLDAPLQKGWLVTDAKSRPEIKAHLQNLYGVPAAGHKMRGKAYISPAKFRFAGYEDWSFADPAPFLGNGSVLDLPETRTDQDGIARLAMPQGLFGQTSARVTVLAEGFDAAGGRGTGANIAFLTSPMSKILGWRPAASLANADFIPAKSLAEVELVAVGPALAPQAWDNLKLAFLRRNYVTSLIADGQGGFRYDDLPQELILREESLNLPARGRKLALETAEPGDFLLEIKDNDGHLLARIPYTVAGNSLACADTPLAGSKMRIKLDKKEYNAGDEIAVALTTPYAAHGILSLERDGVHAFAWVEAKPGSNLAKIRIPADFEGRGHLVATLLRDADSSAIYMTPLAHAAAPFIANIAKRDVKLRLEAAAKAAPGGKLSVKISADEPASAILFAVDEGVLQLANYATPQPLADLLANRALDVTTIQAMDLLMPEHGRIASRLAAFGGGADGGAFGPRFQNPFKRRKEPPLAMWSGLVKIGPEAREITIPLPAWYSGKARVMAVASSSGAAGSGETAATVAGPIVLTPQAPLAVAPGDIFAGSLIVANTTDKNQELALALRVPESLATLKPLATSLKLAPGEETALPFSLKVLEQPGEATLAFAAKMGTDTFVRDLSLSIRPASSLRVTTQAGLMDKSGLLPKTRPVYAAFASSTAMVSGLPLPLAASLGAYLQTYPYGCTEQLTSRAFAVALLQKWVAQGSAEKWQKLLEATDSAIASRFQDGRGIALWPKGEPDLLLTAYAADYLLSLREQGLPVNTVLLQNLCDALAWNCALNEPSLQATRASAYAIWILAREGRVVTQLLEELLQAITEKGISGFEADIAAQLVAAAKLEMSMPVILSAASLNLKADHWFDEYAQIALYLTLKAKYAPESISQPEREDFYQNTTLVLNQSAFSTFSAAQGVRALLALGAAASPASLNASLVCEGQAAKTSYLADRGILQAETEQCSQYRLTLPEGATPLFWQISTTGYDLAGPQKAQANGLEIERVYLNENGDEVQKASQGDVLTVRIRARAQGDQAKDCVISDLLPGGLEMVIPPRSGEKLPQGVKYLDRQEDRLLLFVDLGSQPLEFSYKARAVSPGSFNVPAAAIESMYDRFLTGNGASSLLEITN